MVKLTKGPGASGPSSSLGIMRFFDIDTGGPKMSPEFIVIIAVMLILIVVIIKNLNLV